MKTAMSKTTIAGASLTLVLFAAAPAALAQAIPVGQDRATTPAAPAVTEPATAEDRLMIVNRNTGRVIYDDGRNDLFCSTRRYIAGYTDWGRPIYRRNMHCR